MLIRLFGRPLNSPEQLSFCSISSLYDNWIMNAAVPLACETGSSAALKRQMYGPAPEINGKYWQLFDASRQLPGLSRWNRRSLDKASLPVSDIWMSTSERGVCAAKISRHNESSKNSGWTSELSRRKNEFPLTRYGTQRSCRTWLEPDSTQLLYND